MKYFKLSDLYGSLSRSEKRYCTMYINRNCKSKQINEAWDQIQKSESDHSTSALQFHRLSKVIITALDMHNRRYPAYGKIRAKQTSRVLYLKGFLEMTRNFVSSLPEYEHPSSSLPWDISNKKELPSDKVEYYISKKENWEECHDLCTDDESVNMGAQIWDQHIRYLSLLNASLKTLSPLTETAEIRDEIAHWDPELYHSLIVKSCLNDIYFLSEGDAYSSLIERMRNISPAITPQLKRSIITIIRYLTLHYLIRNKAYQTAEAEIRNIRRALELNLANPRPFLFGLRMASEYLNNGRVPEASFPYPAISGFDEKLWWKSVDLDRPYLNMLTVRKATDRHRIQPKRERVSYRPHQEHRENEFFHQVADAPMDEKDVIDKDD